MPPLKVGITIKLYYEDAKAVLSGKYRLIILDEEGTDIGEVTEVMNYEPDVLITRLREELGVGRVEPKTFKEGFTAWFKEEK